MHTQRVSAATPQRTRAVVMLLCMHARCNATPAITRTVLANEEGHVRLLHEREAKRLLSYET
jgi:hypothetical protein